MIKDRLYGSKKGAAAFYVVIFTMLLLSVITMSFIRIMISEATKSTNDDLSKSAYDSALAGVEDAKIALVKYHQCLDAGYTGSQNGTGCQKIIWDMRNGGCDTVSKVLGRNQETGGVGEVRIREGALNNGTSLEMEQAYTCVKISEDLDDYRSQVNDNHRVRMIPIRTDDINKVTGIEFKWSSGKTNTSDSLVPLSTYNANNSIPIIALDFYQTDPNFTLGELSVNNGNRGTDHVPLVFQPQRVSGVTRISSNEALNAADKANNSPTRTNCGNGGEFQCHTVIQFPAPFGGGARSESTSLLRVELPYGSGEDSGVDFAIRLCTGTDLNHLCDTTTDFLGVQAQIDSTGRANDLFRRVDARVELIDTNFPYPEFAIQLSGGDDKSIEKYFWVTQNCWKTSDSEGAYDGSVSSCSNTGKV